ncbi:MAG: anhydro-N-acetylmuramic acid kinase [Flavobacteriia bacterium]|nr:anhydro-N-acetylmuramic acid kinase [Flavobacteriia bacterium]
MFFGQLKLHSGGFSIFEDHANLRLNVKDPKEMEQITVNAVGLMSGTSLDGLDICLVQFNHKAVSEESDPRKYLPWTFQILGAHTYLHSPAQKEELKKAHLLADIELGVLDKRYAKWVVEKLQKFAQEHPIKTAEVIGFHGPTIFHDVANKISVQLGDASFIAQELNCPVVADFRSADLLAGGRGAPLVPMGDALLFNSFDARVNLGGFANFSLDLNGATIASDSSICNFALDRLAQKMGNPYDRNGQLSAQGTVDKALLRQLEETMEPFTSGVALSREWAEAVVLPVLCDAELPSALTTLCEHVALQLKRRLKSAQKVLLSGGGAYNDHLVARIRQHLPGSVHIPDTQTIEMKEALIFALLAYLKKAGSHNVLKETTGTGFDHTTGALFMPS